MTVADRLVPMITEVTPVNESMIRLRISHSLSFISLVSLYGPTGVSEISVKEPFYAQFQMVVHSCSKRDTLTNLGDFISTTCTYRDDCESYFGHYGT